MNRGLVMYTVYLDKCYVKYCLYVDGQAFFREAIVLLTRSKKYGTGYRVSWS
jgi:hypothetical protein